MSTASSLDNPAAAEVVGPLVAVAQLTATSDHAQNFADAAVCAREAAALGCALLCLPECFSFIGRGPGEAQAQAEPLSGPRVQQYQALAKESRLWLSCGGFHERTSGPPPPAASPHDQGGSEAAAADAAAATTAAAAAPPKVFNSHLLIDPNGELVAVYRKVHLFDVDVPNGPVLMESNSTWAGHDLVVVDPRPFEAAAAAAAAGEHGVVPAATPPPPPLGLTLGLTTCYDMRFPEMYTLLRGLGAEVLLVPSAFTVPTGAAHWEVLLRARAIETQSFVLAAAQVGQHNAKRASWGYALIVDPWGVVLADAGGIDAGGIDVGGEGRAAPKIITARLDLKRLAEVRERMPVVAHRRTDLFTVAQK